MTPPWDLVIRRRSKWQIGILDRGHGHKSYHVIDDKSQLIVDCGDHMRLAFLFLNAPLFAASLMDAAAMLESKRPIDPRKLEQIKKMAGVAESVLQEKKSVV